MTTVNRCICFNRTFDEILLTYRTLGLRDIEDVKSITGCGTKCGLCIPYIEKVVFNYEPNKEIDRNGGQKDH